MSSRQYLRYEVDRKCVVHKHDLKRETIALGIEHPSGSVPRMSTTQVEAPRGVQAAYTSQLRGKCALGPQFSIGIPGDWRIGKHLLGRDKQ